MDVETLSLCVYGSFNLASFTNMISSGTISHWGLDVKIETQVSRTFYTWIFLSLNGIFGSHLWAQLAKKNTNGCGQDFSISEASMGGNLSPLSVKCPASRLHVPPLFRVSLAAPKFQAWGSTGHEVRCPQPCLFTGCIPYLSFMKGGQTRRSESGKMIDNGQVPQGELFVLGMEGGNCQRKWNRKWRDQREEEMRLNWALLDSTLHS